MEAWRSFVKGEWNNSINVRDFINLNYTPYDGDASFLQGPTERTKRVSNRLQELLREEYEKGGVLDVDTETVQTILAFDNPSEEELKEAKTDLEKATELDDKFIDAYYYLAIVKMKLGLYESAIVSLDKVLAIQPQSPYSKALKKLIMKKYLHMDI